MTSPAFTRLAMRSTVAVESSRSPYPNLNDTQRARGDTNHCGKSGEGQVLREGTQPPHTVLVRGTGEVGHDGSVNDRSTLQWYKWADSYAEDGRGTSRPPLYTTLRRLVQSNPRHSVLRQPLLSAKLMYTSDQRSVVRCSTAQSRPSPDLRKGSEGCPRPSRASHRTRAARGPRRDGQAAGSPPGGSGSSQTCSGKYLPAPSPLFRQSCSQRHRTQLK